MTLPKTFVHIQAATLLPLTVRPALHTLLNRSAVSRVPIIPPPARRAIIKVRSAAALMQAPICPSKKMCLCRFARGGMVPVGIQAPLVLLVMRAVVPAKCWISPRAVVIHINHNGLTHLTKCCSRQGEESLQRFKRPHEDVDQKAGETLISPAF